MAKLARWLDSVIDRAVEGAHGASVTETESRTLPTPSILAVEAVNGDVTVSGADRGDVRVTITKRGPSEAALEAASVTATGGDGDEPLELVVEHESGLRPSSGVAVDLDVAVPDDVRIARVTTKNGRIELEDAAATDDARLETKNGRVTAVNVDGRLSLRSTNGTVEARDVTAIDRATTSNGTVDVDLGTIRGETVVEATNGSVDVRVGPAAAADVTISTNVGSIDAPAIGERTVGIGVNRVDGTLGVGGPPLRIETKVGSITLTRSGE